jgi:uncharacterized cupredoxin-like copper-binding protein
MLRGAGGIAAALLLAVAAQAQQGVDWSKAETITLMLVDDHFVPQRLTLRHGVPYLIHMENHGRNLHEFTAPAFFADAILRDPHVLAAEGRAVVVQPAWAVDLYLVPIKHGSYPLICADHDWAGMVGDIIVE